jgi:cytochrome c oxidase subunit 3
MTTKAKSSHDKHYDPEANKMGFWLFLFTEIFLFGALFIAFAVYLTKYMADFQYCASQQNVLIGTVNTCLLLTSSLSAALAVHALQVNRARASIGYLLATIALAIAFCGLKYFEWQAKIGHGIYPGSEQLAQLPHGQQVYYGLYYTLTGCHALHVVIGALLLAVTAILIARGSVHRQRLSLLDNAVLFWHLVDVIWIFLFPLLYLIN